MENKKKLTASNATDLAQTPAVDVVAKTKGLDADKKDNTASTIYSTSATQIRNLLLKEVKSMTRYAMSSGMYKLPDHIYPVIEAFSVEYEEREKEKNRLKDNYSFNRDEALDLTKLVEVHDLLSQAIAPATPRAVLLLDPVFAEKSALSWISPVPLLRRLMIVAFLSLNGFILLALSPEISADGGDIFKFSGLPLLTNLMFFFIFSQFRGVFFSLVPSKQLYC